VTAEQELPEAIRRATDRWVDSLDGLEVLLLLFRAGDRGRAVTASDAAAALGVAEASAARELAKLQAHGLALADLAAGFRWSAPPEAAADAALIAAAYRERRVELINHVASSALRRIRGLAAGFRIKPDGEGGR
jgi:hypothetical protein